MSDLNNIPEGWREVTLEELIDVKHGFAFKGAFISELPNKNILVTPGNFKVGGGFKSDKFKYYHGEIPTNYILKRNDVIVTMTDLSKEGDTLGFSAKVPNDENQYLHNQRIGLVLFKNDIFDKEFSYWLLRTRNYQKSMVNSSTGSTVSHTSPSRIQEYSFNLPPLPEQKSIASILTCFDKKIELLHSQNKTLETIAQTIFTEWFGKYQVGDELPEGWKVGKLDDVIEFINGYAFKSKDLLKEPSINTYNVFKMGSIKKGGGFNHNKTKSYFNKEDAIKLSKYILKSGDLLMSMTDMKDAISLLGHTALMIYDDEYIVNQRVGLIRARNDINIDYPFLYLLTNDKHFIANLRGRANSGVQVNLSTQAIKESLFNIPDQATNIKFDALVKPLFEKRKHNYIKIQTLTKMRDTLLPKLMSGDIRVNKIAKAKN